jgi:hypothetical protein
VKVTYEAIVDVPAPLVALMSAAAADSEPNADASRLRYAFRQPTPIPSYLLALAVGALESRDIGRRSRVWSEASMVVRCASPLALSFAMLPLLFIYTSLSVRMLVRTSLPTLKSFCKRAKRWSDPMFGVNTTFFCCLRRFPMAAWRFSIVFGRVR